MVIDASVAFKLVVEEPDSGEAVAWLGRTELVAPTLIHAEVGNALWKQVLRKEIVADDELGARLADLGSYIRTVDELPFVPRALELAIELRHPMYDCVYLAVAEAEEDRLLTADRRFVRATEKTRYAARVVALGND
jgi:predicted nucleic acid-binding protein